MTILTLIASVVLAVAAPQKETMKQLTDRVFEAAKAQLTALDASVPEDKMPDSFADGKLKTSKLNGWTSGFFPGSLWYTYEYTGDEAIKALAEKQTARLSGICGMNTHHDIGFQVNSSFGNAYRLTGDKQYLKVMKKASAKLCGRFNPVVGCTKSWDGHKGYEYPVIIDNMMNLELLMNTYGLCGGDTLKAVATTHANTTLKNHFRPDGSSYHVLAYDPATGEVLAKMTAQGFCDASAWSRGTAWSLYGFTMMYRQTRDAAYLEQACRTAGFIIPLLPADGVPEWDFNAPGTAHAMGMSEAGAPKKYEWKEGDKVERDASAGAIIASALVELSTFTKGEKSAQYLATAERILRSLASPAYFNSEGNGGFLISHCVVNLHGGKGVDVPLTYADYYFLEALIRYDRLTRPSGKRVMARAVPEREDDFVFENEYVAGRLYGKGLERETISPGIDMWVKAPGALVADDMYASKLSYHKFGGKGKDCYKVAQSLGAGASGVMVGGKIAYPTINYRSYEILEDTDTKVVFVLHYPEWEFEGEKITLDKKITVTSGTHFVRVDDTYRFSGAHGSKLMVVAGVNRHPEKAPVLAEIAEKGRYALWEHASDQSQEAEDGLLGVAVYAPKATLCEVSADGRHGLVGRNMRSGKTFTYWFGHAWSKGDVATAEEWMDMVRKLK